MAPGDISLDALWSTDRYLELWSADAELGVTARMTEVSPDRSAGKQVHSLAARRRRNRRIEIEAVIEQGIVERPGGLSGFLAGAAVGQQRVVDRIAYSGHFFILLFVFSHSLRRDNICTESRWLPDRKVGGAVELRSI